MFKVVPDQLRISDGWVRCGHCAQVFDAAEHLQNDPSPDVADTVPGFSSDVTRSAESVEPDAGLDTALVDSNAPPAMMAQADTGLAAHVAMESEPEDAVTFPLPLESAAQVLPVDDVDPVDAFMQEAIAALPQTPERLSVDALQPMPVSIEQELAAWVAERPAAPLAQPLPAASDIEPDDLSFVREAKRKAFWRRPPVRAGMAVLGLALVAALASQWAIHDRDRIATFEPRARPVLAWLCSLAKCTISPLRQIDSIAIESSSFSKVRDNLYRLNLVIKSSATVELAMPSIELTLMDTQEQPVLRRILTSTELGAPAVMAPTGEWAASLPIAVAADSIAIRIAGYRVLAFYP